MIEKIISDTNMYLNKICYEIIHGKEEKNTFSSKEDKVNSIFEEKVLSPLQKRGNEVLYAQYSAYNIIRKEKYMKSHGLM